MSMSERAGSWRKSGCLKKVVVAAERRRREPFMMIGDWNTGDFPLDKESPGRACSCTGKYLRMADHMASSQCECQRVLVEQPRQRLPHRSLPHLPATGSTTAGRPVLLILSGNEEYRITPGS